MGARPGYKCEQTGIGSPPEEMAAAVVDCGITEGRNTKSLHSGIAIQLFTLLGRRYGETYGIPWWFNISISGANVGH